MWEEAGGRADARARQAMEYHEYERRTREAVDLNQAGDPAGASALFEAIAGDSTLTEMDRNIMFRNAALLRESTGTPEETEWLYDQAVGLERRWCRGAGREAKAAWLERTGRQGEAAAVDTELQAEGWLLSAERRKYEEAVFRTRR